MCAILEIAQNDESSISKIRRNQNKVFMNDGTVYEAIYDNRIADGKLIDQLIISDDLRWSVYDQQFQLIQNLKTSLIRSCVPDELLIQEYLR